MISVKYVLGVTIPDQFTLPAMTDTEVNLRSFVFLAVRTASRQREGVHAGRHRKGRRR